MAVQDPCQLGMDIQKSCTMCTNSLCQDAKFKVPTRALSSPNDFSACVLKGNILVRLQSFHMNMAKTLIRLREEYLKSSIIEKTSMKETKTRRTACQEPSAHSFGKNTISSLIQANPRSTTLSKQ